MSTLDKIPRHLLERAAADPRNGKAAVNALQAALASRGPTTPRTSAEASGRGSSAAGKGKKRGQMNATEARFAREVLDPLVAAGQYERYEYEALTLRIPNVGAVTPDFVAWRDGVPTLFEVKGRRHVHEASVLRMKAHATARPWLRWMIYRRTQEGWTVYWDSHKTVGVAHQR